LGVGRGEPDDGDPAYADLADRYSDLAGVDGEESEDEG
jgi:hypothetical protein